MSKYSLTDIGRDLLIRQLCEYSSMTRKEWKVLANKLLKVSDKDCLALYEALDNSVEYESEVYAECCETTAEQNAHHRRCKYLYSARTLLWQGAERYIDSVNNRTIWEELERSDTDLLVEYKTMLENDKKFPDQVAFIGKLLFKRGYYV